MNEPHDDSNSAQQRALWQRERLADLERRSLLAEQARQLAHRMRTPLSVIELIGETLQIELQDDQATAERLDPVIDAASRLATTLTDVVRSTRFADGHQRPVDAAAIAARLVRLHDGCVDGGAEPPTRWPKVMLEPTAFEAAVMHALRLIGVGMSDVALDRGARPSLTCQAADGVLVLCLANSHLTDGGPPAERSDRDLMAQAAERVARDTGGSLKREGNAVTFILPVVTDPAHGR